MSLPIALAALRLVVLFALTLTPNSWSDSLGGWQRHFVSYIMPGRAVPCPDGDKVIDRDRLE